jgi:hypothetical protein
MERWILILLCLLLVGLMAFAVFTLRAIQREGIAIRLAGPLRIEGSPQEGRLTIAIQGPVDLVLKGPDAASLEARVEGALFPRCEDGVLIPIRWNPFSGEVVWRCVSENTTGP